MTLRDQAALALDRTHDLDGRGPRTYMARQRVALWLDTGQGRVRNDVAWLLSLRRLHVIKQNGHFVVRCDDEVREVDGLNEAQEAARQMAVAHGLEPGNESLEA